MNKHKLFLLCAKWIPVVTAIGILVTNTIAYYGQTARFNDRNQINAEMFGIYKSQVDADLGLYKSTRD